MGEKVTDKIQAVIAARAEKLGLSAYAISQRLGGAPSKETVARYLAGRCALNSRYVSALCEVLGLELRVRR